jgi:hypothetical protein
MAEYLRPQPEPYAEGPRRWWTRPWTITLTIAIVGSILICGACAGFRAMMGPVYAMGAGMMDQMDMTSGFNVVGDYLTAMHYGDAERAYRYYSDDAKQAISQQDLEDELDSPRGLMYKVYDGFDFGAPITQSAQNPNATTVEEMLEGTRIVYDGVIYLSGYDSASFHAVVIYQSGEWKIAELDIEPPPGLD